MKLDISTITNPEAKFFITHFLADRAINHEFYELIPKDKFDYRMVDTPERKSDSPRESLAHQIYVTRKYIYGAKTGTLKFDGIIEKELPDPKTLSKMQLLEELDATNQELVELLSGPNIATKKVKVPWSPNPLTIVQMLWALDSHEILHTGWNLAVMDHLDIKRFKSLKTIWG